MRHTHKKAISFIILIACLITTSGFSSLYIVDEGDSLFIDEDLFLLYSCDCESHSDRLYKFTACVNDQHIIREADCNYEYLTINEAYMAGLEPEHINDVDAACPYCGNNGEARFWEWGRADYFVCSTDSNCIVMTRWIIYYYCCNYMPCGRLLRNVEEIYSVSHQPAGES